MRDFLGGVFVMTGCGLLAWGMVFLLSHPLHGGEGRAAVIFGALSVLAGVAMILPSTRDSD